MNLKKKTISGVKWTTLSTIILTIGGIIKLSVLTRYLSAEDFGLMALVTFVLGFMNLFTDMGLTSAILYKQNITRREYSSLFILNLFFSLFLFLLIFMLSDVIAGFYKEKELSNLIPLMGVSLFFFALGNQYKTIEQKNFNFKYIALVEIFSSILGILLAIILAIKGYGVYTLVYSALFQYGLSNFLFFLRGINRRGFIIHFDIKETESFLKIGGYQIGAQIVNYFNRDIDVLLIGKFFGVEILGGYNLAKQLIRRPLQITSPVLNRVSMSIFPKFQQDKIKLSKYFKKLFTIAGVFNSLIYSFMVIFAHWLVLFLYGEKLLNIVFYVQLFALATFLRSMGGITGILVVTKGRTDYDFIWNIIITFIMPITIYIGSQISIEIVILFLGILQLFILIPNWYMFFYRLIDYPFEAYIKPHIYPLGLSLISIFLLKIFDVDSLFFSFLSFSLLISFLIVYSYFNVPEFQSIINKFFRKYDRV